MLNFPLIIESLSTLLECRISTHLTGEDSSVYLTLTFELDEKRIGDLPYASPLLCAEELMDYINDKIGTSTIRNLQAKLEKEDRKRRSEKRKHYEEVEALKAQIAELEKYKMFYDMHNDISRGDFDISRLYSIKQRKADEPAR